MNDRDVVLLRDIVNWTAKVIKLAGATSQEAFRANEGIQFQLIYPIQVVGEAA